MAPISELNGKEALLVRQAQAGDMAAFDRLAGHYRASLLAHAFLRTGDMEAAEDLVQEVLTRAWQKLADLHEPAAFVPWLRVITANACRSWYRRARPWTASLDDEAGSQPLTDRRPQPLDALLAREKQRALRQALVALPYANRVALLMHVWGEYSYQEIADFTDVPVTTVEGRIHRAKRQLRRLLRAAGGEYAGEPAPARSTQSGRKPMNQPHAPAPASGYPVRSLALVLFSHQLSTLLDTGVPLVRSLEALEEAPPPYGAAARELRRRIEQGETLSAAMADHAELFPAVYRSLVRAGEVGQVLEETLRRAAELMTKEWKVARSYPDRAAPIFLINPGGSSLPDDWNALTEYQRTVLRALFCETFGLLLASGIPIMQTMRILADLLPSALAERLLAAVTAVGEGKPMFAQLEPLGILPRFAIELIAVGEQTGHLDAALERAAEVFLHELECRLLAEA